MRRAGREDCSCELFVVGVITWLDRNIDFDMLSSSPGNRTKLVIQVQTPYAAMCLHASHYTGRSWLRAQASDRSRHVVFPASPDTLSLAAAQSGFTSLHLPPPALTLSHCRPGISSALRTGSSQGSPRQLAIWRRGRTLQNPCPPSYRGTSHIRKSLPLGPYSTPVSRALR